MLAAILAATGNPCDEIRLTDDEAHQLAARIVAVERHYKIPSIPDDKLALAMLAVTGFKIYAPKAAAIYVRVNTPPAPPPPDPGITVTDIAPTYVPPDDPGVTGWFGTGEPGTGLH